MRISASQAATLARPQEQTFDGRAQAFLKREIPALAERDDPAPLARFVSHGRARAGMHGFASESQIVRYLLVMIRLGPFFDEDPANADALKPALDAASETLPEQRLRTLVEAAAAAPHDDENAAAATIASASAATSEFSSAPPGAPIQFA